MPVCEWIQRHAINLSFSAAIASCNRIDFLQAGALQLEDFSLLSAWPCITDMWWWMLASDSFQILLKLVTHTNVTKHALLFFDYNTRSSVRDPNNAWAAIHVLGDDASGHCASIVAQVFRHHRAA